MPPADDAPPPDEGAVVLDDVTVQVPAADTAGRERTLLTGVTARLAESRIAVVGLNGSGKSTLLRLLNGLVLPTTGRVRVHGIEVAHDVRTARRAVGFLFADPAAQLLMPTAQEDVELSLRSREPSSARRSERARRLLEDVGLGDRRHQSVHDLSSGERQLAALAAVLAVSPRVLALDEPTTLLDLRHRDRLIDRLDALPQQLVIATHDLDLAAAARRVLVLHRGRLLVDGPPGPALDAYRRFCRDGFPDGRDGAPPQEPVA